jgi:hypothetical protein
MAAPTSVAEALKKPLPMGPSAQGRTDGFAASFQETPTPGSTYAISQGPLCRALRSFTGPILKAAQDRLSPQLEAASGVYVYNL